MTKFYSCTAIFLISCWNVIYARNEFVANLLLNFPTYIQENGLDPSDISTEPTLVQLTGIDAEITNHQVSGHSQANLTIQNIILGLPSGIIPGLLQINMLLGNQNTTLEGNYRINGTLSPNTTISGEGKWTANPTPGGSTFNVFILFEDLSLTEDGLYLNLKGSRAKYGNLAFYGTRVYKLEGLLAGGQEERITNVVMNSYFDSLRNNRKLPLLAQIMQYLENAFEKTPIQDIIGNFN